MAESVSGTFGAGSVYRRTANETWVNPILLSASPAASAIVTTYSGYIVFSFVASGSLVVGGGVPFPADVLTVGGGSPATAAAAPVPAIGPPTGNGGPGGNVLATPGHTIIGRSVIPVVVGGASTNSTFGSLSSASGVAGGAGGAGSTAPGYTSSLGAAGTAGPTNNYRTGSNQNYGGGGGGGTKEVFGWNGTAPYDNPFNRTGYIYGYTGGAGGAGGGGRGGGVSQYADPATYLTRAVAAYENHPSFTTDNQAGSANTGGGGGGRGAGETWPPTSPPISLQTNLPGGSGIVVVRFPTNGFRV